MEEYYTVQQASKLLGISVSSFKKLFMQGSTLMEFVKLDQQENIGVKEI